MYNYLSISLSLSMCVYIYICREREREREREMYVYVCSCVRPLALPPGRSAHAQQPRGVRREVPEYYSGSCRCALIGVPCRLSMLSTFSTFANILF